MHPRVLIVGTVPYNKQMTSRSFDAYFHNWEKENLAQIFSHSKKPVKGHCGTFFQITDQRLIKKRFKKSISTGCVYNDEELDTDWNDLKLETNSKVFNWLYKIGHKKTPLLFLIRRFVWKEKYWKTIELDEWLDKFKPECVFLSFSDDFFILNIAMFVAKKYNIPIIPSIGDDYYFNDRKSISPLYYIYRKQYKNLVNKLLMECNEVVYISDLIKEKYNKEFNLCGETIYLTSEIQRKERSELKNTIKFAYFGNISLGRNKSLNEIGLALGNMSQDYILYIYSNESDRSLISVFDNNKNIRFMGSISYSEVLEQIKNSDIIVVVEGFEDSNINTVKYSLSTKVADCLASGDYIFAYGPLECGAIDYLEKTEAAVVCNKRNDIVPMLQALIKNEEYQKQLYEKAICVTEKNHTLKSSTNIFENLVRSAIYRRRNETNE